MTTPRNRTFRMADDEWDRHVEAAFQCGVTMSEYIRRALDEKSGDVLIDGDDIRLEFVALDDDGDAIVNLVDRYTDEVIDTGELFALQKKWPSIRWRHITDMVQ